MSKPSVRLSAAPSVAPSITSAMPPAPKPPTQQKLQQQQQQQQQQPVFIPAFINHCHSIVIAASEEQQKNPQPLYLDGINHCPECNPKHIVNAPRCQHDLRLGRLSGRPLRRRNGESIEDFTFRVNDVFKVCPLEREWSVATTNYFKMDFLHSWLEGLRSKYMSSIVLSMEASSAESGTQLTVEKAVHSLRQVARQEDFIRQMAVER